MNGFYFCFINIHRSEVIALARVTNAAAKTIHSQIAGIYFLFNVGYRQRLDEAKKNYLMMNSIKQASCQRTRTMHVNRQRLILHRTIYVLWHMNCSLYAFMPFKTLNSICQKFYMYMYGNFNSTFDAPAFIFHLKLISSIRYDSNDTMTFYAYPINISDTRLCLTKNKSKTA